MNLLKAIRNWNNKKENSDFSKIKINSSGSFYMTTKDLFNNKEEIDSYIKILQDSLKKRKENIVKAKS